MTPLGHVSPAAAGRLPTRIEGSLPDRRGTGSQAPASTRRPDGAPSGADPGPAGADLGRHRPKVRRDARALPERGVAMRRTPSLVLLTAIVLVASACSSSATPAPQGGGPSIEPASPAHAAAAAREHPVRRGHVPGPGRRTRTSIRPRIASRRSPSTSTPPRTRSPVGSSPTATCPIRPASGPRSSSTTSTRATRRPRTAPSRSRRDGAPTPFLPADEVLLRIGIKARTVADRQRPRASLTFVIDVSGSMAREDRLELVKQSLRLLVDQLGRTTPSRSWSSGPTRARSSSRRRGDDRSRILVGDRHARARGLDERRGRPPARLRGREPPSRRGRHQSGDPRLGRRGQRGPHRPAVDPRPDQARRVGRASSSSPSASGWATTTTCCWSSSPTRATGSTPTSTRSTRHAACSWTT